MKRIDTAEPLCDEEETIPLMRGPYPGFCYGWGPCPKIGHGTIPLMRGPLPSHFLGLFWE